ncbi:ferredoxin [Streptomyces sp. NPDC057580]|uniref:ferredoxin n=1 Tax=Streptomyces sp. NPDC057580 TaxID=3346173 RepID=UPI0036AD3CDA
MHIHVNADRCQGHSRCSALLPALIAHDEFGYAQVLGNGEVPPELADVALLAVRNCPESALVGRGVRP